MSRTDGETRRPSLRAQSEVVGVALLLGVTVVGLGALTLTIGVVLDENAAAADANAVATDLKEGIDPVTAAGTRETTVSFTDGTLRTVERTIRVLDGEETVSSWTVGAIEYETDGHRVVVLGGAVVESRGDYAHVHEEPPVAASEGVFLAGIVDFEPTEHVSHGGTGASTLTLRTTVSHDRSDLGAGDYAIAVETSTPDAWTRAFDRSGATTRIESFDDDEYPSAIAQYDGERAGYVVVHDVNLEVYHG